ncbi:MAG: VanZ family protein [Bacilli bacterium]|nr:VanZ family protein [Bacilli bacterium]
MKTLNILLLVLWMLIIFTFSNANSTKSTNTSDKVIDIGINIVDSIRNEKTENKELLIEKLTFIVRKIAHFLEYLILGILMYRVVSDYTNKNVLILSILLCILYATTDEIHQIFINGRDGNIKDVLVDSIGIIIGCLIYKKIKENKRVLNKNCV